MTNSNTPESGLGDVIHTATTEGGHRWLIAGNTVTVPEGETVNIENYDTILPGFGGYHTDETVRALESQVDQLTQRVALLEEQLAKLLPLVEKDNGPQDRVVTISES